jgi:hypothetical protein
MSPCYEARATGATCDLMDASSLDRVRCESLSGSGAPRCGGGHSAKPSFRKLADSETLAENDEGRLSVAHQANASYPP